MELTRVTIYRKLILKLLVCILYRVLGSGGFLAEEETKLVNEVEEHLKDDYI